MLVGLAVGDEAMITERLNTRESGDLMDEINAHRLRVNYGPHLVRVTRQDMQAWMPDVRPAKPLAIDPDPALQQLLDAIRRGGREAYRRLLEVLRELKTLETGSELFKQALAELSRAQGVLLGNVGVYVDASVDPETLTHSQAALAKALVRQGLVADAVRGGGDGLPLLRGITAQTLAGVAGEEQVIVFAERVWCLRQLAHTLTEGHDVETHVADGQIKPHEFEALKHRFTSGEFPVLCLSQDRRGGPQPPERVGASCTSICRGCHRGLSSASAGPHARAPRAAGCRHTSRTSAARASSTSSRSSPPAAPSTTPCSTHSRASPPTNPPSPHSSARSPARSPTPNKTPATPPPPHASAWPQACSAPELGPLAGRAATPAPTPDPTTKGGRA